MKLFKVFLICLKNEIQWISIVPVDIADEINFISENQIILRDFISSINEKRNEISLEFSWYIIVIFSGEVNKASIGRFQNNFHFRIC